MVKKFNEIESQKLVERYTINESSMTSIDMIHISFNSVFNEIFGEELASKLVGDNVVILRTPDLRQEQCEIIYHTYLVKSNQLCKDLDRIYVYGSLKLAPIIVSIVRTDARGDHCLAFITLEMEKYAMHILIICSSFLFNGNGKILMHLAEKITRELEVPSIKLDSVPDAVSFYEKFGFIKVLTRPTDRGLYPMTKQITKEEFLYSKSKTSKRVSAKSAWAKSATEKTKHKKKPTTFASKINNS